MLEIRVIGLLTPFQQLIVVPFIFKARLDGAWKVEGVPATV